MLEFLLIIFAAIFIILFYLLFGGDKNKKCAWCNNRKIKFIEGKAGSSSWRHQNNDGSQDKRFKHNYLESEYSSKYFCSKCQAYTKFEHIHSQLRSSAATVWKRTLDSDGLFGDRKGSDWIDTNYYPRP
tara:strand:+ start:1943 stop:2329 length:387 start_codon:yes stop_codon:yes gene_type:complete